MDIPCLTTTRIDPGDVQAGVRRDGWQVPGIATTLIAGDGTTLVVGRDEVWATSCAHCAATLVAELVAGDGPRRETPLIGGAYDGQAVLVSGARLASWAAAGDVDGVVDVAGDLADALGLDPVRTTATTTYRVDRGRLVATDTDI